MATAELPVSKITLVLEKTSAVLARFLEVVPSVRPTLWKRLHFETES